MSPITMTGPEARRAPNPMRTATDLTPYTTLMGLRTELRALEHVGNLSVVLVLDERFCGHLASLIERPAARPAMRLILAVGSGRLPGLETIGDLAATGAALGWQEIVLETDAASAVAAARSTLRAGERLVTFVPSWH